MKRLVLLRHGESVWNLTNRFTGWTDVDLSENGKAEARKAGALLKKYEFSFDRAYTSVLKRAVRTLWIVLDELDEMWLPTEHNWRLNERHYGALQGLNKAETALLAFNPRARFECGAENSHRRPRQLPAGSGAVFG